MVLLKVSVFIYLVFRLKSSPTLALFRAKANQEVKEKLPLMDTTEGVKVLLLSQTCRCLLSEVCSSAITPSTHLCLLRRGRGSGLWRQRHIQADTVKLCRMWRWVELIKEWESLGGWALAQSGAQRQSKADKSWRTCRTAGTSGYLRKLSFGQIRWSKSTLAAIIAVKSLCCVMLWRQRKRKH